MLISGTISGRVHVIFQAEFCRRFRHGLVSILRFGKAVLAFASSMIKGRDFIEVLEGHPLPVFGSIPEENLVYQQDNTSVHSLEL